MTAPFMANLVIIALYNLTPGKTFEQEFSVVSLENILFDILAFAAFGLESLWDIFRIETETAMAKQRIHSQEWYRQKALGFRYGIPFKPDSDEYDYTGYTDEQIAAATVVNQAACIKLISSNGYGILRVKVAKANGSGELGQLPIAEFNAFKSYMLRRVVDAGTQVRSTTGDPDDLKLQLDIYFDPQILSNTGERLDGTNATPVQTEIVNFLKSTQFNGSLILSDLEKALRALTGVKIAVVKNAASKYGGFAYDTVGTPGVGAINEIRVADSGYMKLDEAELSINWISHNE